MGKMLEARTTPAGNEVVGSYNAGDPKCLRAEVQHRGQMRTVSGGF